MPRSGRQVWRVEVHVIPQTRDLWSGVGTRSHKETGFLESLEDVPWFLGGCWEKVKNRARL